MWMEYISIWVITKNWGRHLLDEQGSFSIRAKTLLIRILTFLPQSCIGHQVADQIPALENANGPSVRVVSVNFASLSLPLISVNHHGPRTPTVRFHGYQYRVV